MRVLAVVLASILWLYACSQPPEVVPDDELFDCELSKDGKFLVCHERKRTETAGDRSLGMEVRWLFRSKYEME